MSGKLPLNLDDLLRRRTDEGERMECTAGCHPDAEARTLIAFADDVTPLRIDVRKEGRT